MALGGKTFNLIRHLPPVGSSSLYLPGEARASETNAQRLAQVLNL
jgi:hypothetical protein